MAKIMLFIDGTWLYATVPALAKSYGKDFQIDFGRLPLVLAEQVQKKIGASPVEVVRTCLFGSYAANYDERDEESVERRLDFFDMLREEYHYEIDIFPINFKGRRLRKADRAPGDPFEPKEKCVDIALASSMLYFAAIPGAYDIALAVIGDQDFKPMLQQVRRLGKRVAIASVKGSCAIDFFDPRGEPRLRDFEPIWLDDLLPQLELKFERHKLPCQSASHQGDREVWTTFRPRRGKPFFCDACREEFNRQKQEAHHEFTPTPVPLSEGAVVAEPGQRLTGMVYEKKEGRGFGFIRADNGKEYYFHFTDLPVDLRFEEVQTGFRVNFEVKREPSDNKAGAARNVRRHFDE